MSVCVCVPSCHRLYKTKWKQNQMESGGRGGCETGTLKYMYMPTNLYLTTIV